MEYDQIPVSDRKDGDRYRSSIKKKRKKTIEYINSEEDRFSVSLNGARRFSVIYANAVGISILIGGNASKGKIYRAESPSNRWQNNPAIGRYRIILRAINSTWKKIGGLPLSENARPFECPGTVGIIDRVSVRLFGVLKRKEKEKKLENFKCKMNF